jgi:hypothetical protein
VDSIDQALQVLTGATCESVDSRVAARIAQLQALAKKLRERKDGDEDD